VQWNRKYLSVAGNMLPWKQAAANDYPHQIIFVLTRAVRCL